MNRPLPKNEGFASQALQFPMYSDNSLDKASRFHLQRTGLAVEHKKVRKSTFDEIDQDFEEHVAYITTIQKDIKRRQKIMARLAIEFYSAMSLQRFFRGNVAKHKLRKLRLARFIYDWWSYHSCYRNVRRVFAKLLVRWYRRTRKDKLFKLYIRLKKHILIIENGYIRYKNRRKLKSFLAINHYKKFIVNRAFVFGTTRAMQKIRKSRVASKHEHDSIVGAIPVLFRFFRRVLIWRKLQILSSYLYCRNLDTYVLHADDNITTGTNDNAHKANVAKAPPGNARKSSAAVTTRKKSSAGNNDIQSSLPWMSTHHEWKSPRRAVYVPYMEVILYILSRLTPEHYNNQYPQHVDGNESVKAKPNITSNDTPEVIASSNEQALPGHDTMEAGPLYTPTIIDFLCRQRDGHYEDMRTFEENKQHLYPHQVQIHDDYNRTGYRAFHAKKTLLKDYELRTSYLAPIEKNDALNTFESTESHTNGKGEHSAHLNDKSHGNANTDKNHNHNHKDVLYEDNKEVLILPAEFLGIFKPKSIFEIVVFVYYLRAMAISIDDQSWRRLVGGGGAHKKHHKKHNGSKSHTHTTSSTTDTHTNTLTDNHTDAIEYRSLQGRPLMSSVLKYKYFVKEECLLTTAKSKIIDLFELKQQDKLCFWQKKVAESQTQQAPGNTAMNATKSGRKMRMKPSVDNNLDMKQYAKLDMSEPRDPWSIKFRSDVGSRTSSQYDLHNRELNANNGDNKGKSKDRYYSLIGHNNNATNGLASELFGPFAHRKASAPIRGKQGHKKENLSSNNTSGDNSRSTDNMELATDDTDEGSKQSPSETHLDVPEQVTPPLKKKEDSMAANEKIRAIRGRQRASKAVQHTSSNKSRSKTVIKPSTPPKTGYVSRRTKTKSKPGISTRSVPDNKTHSKAKVKVDAKNKPAAPTYGNNEGDSNHSSNNNFDDMSMMNGDNSDDGEGELSVGGDVSVASRDDEDGTHHHRHHKRAATTLIDTSIKTALTSSVNLFVQQKLKQDQEVLSLDTSSEAYQLAKARVESFHEDLKHEEDLRSIGIYKDINSNAHRKEQYDAVYNKKKSPTSLSNDQYDKADKVIDDRIKEARSTASPIRPMNEIVIPSYTHEEFEALPDDHPHAIYDRKSQFSNSLGLGVDFVKRFRELEKKDELERTKKQRLAEQEALRKKKSPVKKVHLYEGTEMETRYSTAMSNRRGGTSSDNNNSPHHVGYFQTPFTLQAMEELRKSMDEVNDIYSHRMGVKYFSKEDEEQILAPLSVNTNPSRFETLYHHHQTGNEAAKEGKERSSDSDRKKSKVSFYDVDSITFPVPLDATGGRSIRGTTVVDWNGVFFEGEEEEGNDDDDDDDKEEGGGGEKDREGERKEEEDGDGEEEDAGKGEEDMNPVDGASEAHTVADIESLINSTAEHVNAIVNEGGNGGKQEAVVEKVDQVHPPKDETNSGANSAVELVVEKKDTRRKNQSVGVTKEKGVDKAMVAVKVKPSAFVKHKPAKPTGSKPSANKNNNVLLRGRNRGVSNGGNKAKAPAPEH